MQDLRAGRKNKLFLAALWMFAVMAALNVVLYAAVVSPAASRVHGQRSALSELRKRQTEALLFQKQRQAFAGLKTGMPTQKDVPLIIKDLIQSARKLNLTTGAISSDIPKQDAGSQTLLMLTVPVSGPYQDLKRFIYEVETTDRLVGIQDLKLFKDKGRLKLEMKLVTYIRSA